MINNCGRKAANVSTSAEGGTQALTCPTLLVRPRSHLSTASLDTSRTTFCFHRTDSWPISLPPRFNASASFNIKPAVASDSVDAFARYPLQLPRNKLSSLAKVRRCFILASESASRWYWRWSETEPPTGRIPSSALALDTVTVNLMARDSILILGFTCGTLRASPLSCWGTTSAHQRSCSTTQSPTTLFNRALSLHHIISCRCDK
jgi:hypothetical protein